MSEVENIVAEETRPRALGRGLSALIGDEPLHARGDAPARGTRTLPVAFLRPNRFQPRKHFAEEELRDLAQSVKEKGVLQPILVRPIAGEPNAFEIVAGERRWRAAQLASLHDVPVHVREITDSESLELAIIENVQRADLNAIEEAAAYHELMERFSYTQERVAQDVGKSRSHVANTLRLLKLPEAVKAHIREGRLSAGQARTLIGEPDPEAIAERIVHSKTTVRVLEEDKRRSGHLTHKARAKDPNISDYESSISNALGLKVQIMHKGDKGGEVRIAYKSLEQLEDVIHRLKNRG